MVVLRVAVVTGFDQIHFNPSGYDVLHLDNGGFPADGPLRNHSLAIGRVGQPIFTIAAGGLARMFGLSVADG